MKIIIETIPHSEQYYPTCGDWFFQKNGKRSEGVMGSDTLVIRVSDMGDWRRELLVAVHELVEVSIALHNGINVSQVDAFDIEFEKNRVEDNTDEPGDDTRCPIKREHCIATGIERILAAELGVSWKEYDTAVNSL